MHTEMTKEKKGCRSSLLSQSRQAALAAEGRSPSVNRLTGSVSMPLLERQGGSPAGSLQEQLPTPQCLTFCSSPAQEKKILGLSKSVAKFHV